MILVALKNIKKSEADSRCELSHYVDGTTKQSTGDCLSYFSVMFSITTTTKNNGILMP